MLGRSDIVLQIVLASHRLYDRGFVTATDGNISGRLDSGNILVTPASLNKGKVAESDLVEVSSTGSAVTLSRHPSSELGMHLFIYSSRPDVHGIVHAHPPFATGFATARIPFPDTLFPEVILGLGHVPLADYATPSTGEVPASLAPFVKESNAVLLANHGVVAFGSSVEDAYFKMEKVEHAAQIAFVARMLGGERTLTGEEIGRLKTAHGYPSDAAKDIAGSPGPAEQAVKQLIREVIEEKLRNRN